MPDTLHCACGASTILDHCPVCGSTALSATPFPAAPATLVNLTPHAVKIGTVTVPPSGTVARVAVTRRRVTDLPLPGGLLIPAFVPAFGEVTDLPEPSPGNVLIVSAIVRSHPAVAHRADVASPGLLVRDASGTITGCDGLDFNF